MAIRAAQPWSLQTVCACYEVVEEDGRSKEAVAPTCMDKPFSEQSTFASCTSSLMASTIFLSRLPWISLASNILLLGCALSLHQERREHQSGRGLSLCLPHDHQCACARPLTLLSCCNTSRYEQTATATFYVEKEESTLSPPLFAGPF